MTPRPPLPRRGLSLIEVLVVLGILAVLLGLTLAAVQRVREAARRAECQDRLRNQGLAALNYEAALGRLPPGAVQGPFARPAVPDGAGHGLWPLLLPYLDQAPLAARYRFDLPFDHPANQPAVTASLKILECPNATPVDRTANWGTGYGGVADYAPLDVNPFLADVGVIDAVSNFQGPLPVNGAVRMTEVTDGTSTTVLLAEASGRPGAAWSSPELLLGLRQFFGRGGGLHRGGSHVCMADGSVHFLSDGLSLRVLGRLATRAGGEVLSGNEF
jgi:prepilin-type N-terminal cleavage/methylation domain-containing protein/prepilin-type processing-associated H-X9-DG protein